MSIAKVPHDYSRAAIANVFREAKKWLNTGKTGSFQIFICLAIRHHVMHLPCAFDAIHVVSSRIAPYKTVEDWVLVNCLDVEEEYPSDDEFQAFRHRWLDALIEEFSQEA